MRHCDIGYATLVLHKLDNLCLLGRFHGAEQAALVPGRVTVTCMATGQAAGTTAALAARANVAARELMCPGTIPG